MSEKNLNKLMKVLLVVSSLSTFVGALAKIQHYSVGDYFFTCGIISFIFLCVLVRSRLNKINKKLKEGKFVE